MMLLGNFNQNRSEYKIDPNRDDPLHFIVQGGSLRHLRDPHHSRIEVDPHVTIPSNWSMYQETDNFLQPTIYSYWSLKNIDRPVSMNHQVP